jgi:hypothetical protein
MPPLLGTKSWQWVVCPNVVQEVPCTVPQRGNWSAPAGWTATAATRARAAARAIRELVERLFMR